MQGYALIEYEMKKEAQAAIDNLNGKQMLTQAICVNWAFSSGPLHRRNVRRRWDAHYCLCSNCHYLMSWVAAPIHL